MAYRLLCFASAVLISFSISSVVKGKTYVNMCENGTTPINEDSLELDAVGPSRNPLTTNTSTTCSCSINVIFDWLNSNEVSVQFSRTSGTTQGNGCSRNAYDKAALDFESTKLTQSLNLTNEELSHFDKKYDDVSTIKISITINSICGSNYTIQLKETSGPFSWPAEFSYVTCSNPETMVTSSSTTPSPTSLKPTGLIVGVVVGVGGGLILIGAVILVVLIFRRRRTKPQSLTNANQNAPTENSYEPTVEYASISYEELRNSTQFQTGTLYDTQPEATDPLDTESGQNDYNLQGIDNSSFHHSDASPISDQTTLEVDNCVQDPHSINDTDTTVIENDLYEK